MGHDNDIAVVMNPGTHTPILPEPNAWYPKIDTLFSET